MSSSKELISELLWLAPRRHDVIDGTDYSDWLLKEVELRYRISFPELF